MTSFIKLPNVNFGSTALGRVRDFDAEIGALSGLLSWHRAQDAEETAAMVDGISRVQSWLPHRGAGNFSQASSAKAPEYFADFEGKPALYFSRPRPDFLSYQGAFPTGQTSKHTKVIVFRPTALMAGAAGFVLSNFVTADGRHSIEMTNTGIISQRVGANFSVAGGSPFLDQWHVAVASFTGSDQPGQSKVRIKIDADPVNELAGDGFPNNAALYMGVQVPTAAGGFDMFVRDAMIFEEDLLAPAQSDSLETVLGYLQSEYGVAAL